MEVDPASLDPEEKMNKFYALFSIGFGLLSLCGAIIPETIAALISPP